MTSWNKRKKQQLVYILVDLLSSILIWSSFLTFRWLVYEGKIFSVDTILIPMFNFYPFCFSTNRDNGFFMEFGWGSKGMINLGWDIKF